MVFTFIGMPGCGKSRMGRFIASKLNYKFIDGDKLIEERTGKLLCTLISELGTEGFKKLEEEILLSVEEDNIILSPGGSAVYYDSFMKKAKERGKLIYIYVSIPVLKQRLGDFSKRGIVLKEGQTLDNLFDERSPLYEKYADIKVNCDGFEYSKYRENVLQEIDKFIN